MGPSSPNAGRSPGITGLVGKVGNMLAVVLKPSSSGEAQHMKTEPLCHEVGGCRAPCQPLPPPPSSSLEPR